MKSQSLTEILETMNSRILRMKKALAVTGTITKHNWVVRCGDFYVSPEFDQTNKPTGCWNIEDPDLVMRFSKNIASDIASVVYNGKNEKGKAVLWKNATKKTLADLEETLKTWSSSTAG